MPAGLLARMTRRIVPLTKLSGDETVALFPSLGHLDERGYLYVYDTSHNGSEYSISFQFPVKDAAADAWIESILASCETPSAALISSRR